MSELIRFHAIATGGEAVGRDAQNRAVFAPFGAPGDVAEVEIRESHASFARGEIARLVEASPQRIAPPCSFYRPQTPQNSCGGCQIQHLDYTAQLAAKRGFVRDALTRIGGLQNVEVEPCVASPREFGYRNKADFVVGGQEIGFFARESHDLVDITQCPLQIEGNNAILQAARKILAQNPDWAFDARTGKGPLRRLIARTATNGQMLLILITNAPTWPAAKNFAGQMRGRLPNLVGVLQRGPREAKGGKIAVVDGQNWLEERVGDLVLRASDDAFFQVNPFLTPLLVETALDLAQVQSGQGALDLFCGVGLFALALGKQGARVLGIENHVGAIQDARFNAQSNGIKADFRVAPAHKALQKFAPGEFDCVFLDPPRAGAAACLQDLARLRPKKMVYVSCDPATLARDAKFLAARGFALRRVIPFDLFPQTAHVETLTLWEFDEFSADKRHEK